ncbi:MAG: Txe/YoeB family addiction module toxin [Firmicutes bacterium]|nr:Txe/YoeB family addiction module toxin [Bacillota bacterium]
MVKYTIIFSKLADKDKKLLKQAGLESKTKELLDIILENPYQTPPIYERLRGNLSGYFSRRISLQHRLVYEVDEEKKEVFILRMWTHYEKLNK